MDDNRSEVGTDGSQPEWGSDGIVNETQREHEQSYGNEQESPFPTQNQQAYRNSYQEPSQNSYQEPYQSSYQSSYQNTYQDQYASQGGYSQELEEPVSMGDWLVSMLLIMFLPCVNIVLLFVWAFNKKEKKSKSNFFKALLIIAAIEMVLVFFILLIVVGFVTAGILA